jgi:uncharacterized protein YhhL (DUF1145 family)
MRYWFREIAGWVLVALGLFIFYLVYWFCTVATLEHPYPRFLETIPMTVIGIFVFRGGLSLLKTAVAARVCQQAQDRLYPPPPPVRALPAKRAGLPPVSTRSMG